MTPTLFEAMFEINVAIVMVAVTVALLVWFQGSLAAISARRTMGMMTRVGLDPGIAALGAPRTKAIMKEARHRCGRCPREDFCDRWLAGKVEGNNTFCLNAQTFRILAATSGSTG
jgi:hypothetical protein